MGFYEPLTMLFVYSGFAAIVFLGRNLADNAPGNKWVLTGSLFGTALVGSLIFFLMSNFGVFLRGDFGYSLAGLTRCYVAAIPFFGNTVSGDIFYGLLLFGSAAATGKLYGINRMQPESAGRAAIGE
jgi:hypothetical protein